MTAPAMPKLLREIVAYCREAGHDWSNLAEAEKLLASPQAQPAEVPEAMGDDLLFRLADDHSESSAGPVGQASEFWAFEQQSLRDFSKALNDALQSTRLRGGAALIYRYFYYQKPATVLVGGSLWPTKAH